MSYWKQIHKIALRETLDVLGLQTRGQFVIRILLVIAALAALFFFGSDDAAQDEIVVRAVLAGVIIAIFPVIYFARLAATPSRIDAEKENKIQEIEQENLRLQEVKAKLEVSILEMNVGDFEQGQGYVFIVQVTNTGDKVSSLPFWAAFIENSEGIRRQLSLIKGEVTMTGQSGQAFTYVTEEQIYVKCRSPINPGHFINGSMACVDTSGEKLQVGDKIIIACKDIHNNVCETSHVNRGEFSEKMFYPGMDRSLG